MSKPKYIFLKETSSTNNKMKELIETSSPEEFSIIQTTHQYAGRGQMGNCWESEKDKNLTFSIFLKPTFLPIQDQFIISKITSLAIIKSLEKFCIEKLKIKWPNDIYVDNKKIAGILIENSIMGKQLFNSIIGIGLNINQIIFSNNAPNATSLAIINNKTYDINPILNDIVNNIINYYILIQQNKTSEIDKKYLQLLYRINENANYKDNSGIFNGIIKGVDSFGRLLIKTANNEIRCYEFKDVAFIIEKETRF
ncbi:MAG: biotin--[acetyl-CoA-carboxylase] ligase [Marinilabiliaceae bacterium]|nr:biotin--[acetyl-CoA-carboxylase] ligase [Marinilabiliaceae bacterium]